MSIKKQFLKTKPVCKVTFKVKAADANGAKSIQILGDFNNWDKSVEPMKALKSGDFTMTLELEKGKSFEMRYYIDGATWTNEPEADSTTTNVYGEINDVIEC